jgi:hypothetical protein
MSTDLGLKEAPFPYHISLNFFSSEIEPDLDEIKKKWDGRRHLVNVDWMSKSAYAAACATCAAASASASAAACAAAAFRCFCYCP